MASPNNPPSSAALIARYSKTRVRTPSNKVFVVGYQRHANGSPILTPDGKLIPILSRPLNRADCVGLLIKKFG